MTTSRKRVPWSPGDRLLMIVLGLALVSVGLGVWLHGRAATPALAIPTPALPSPNAYDYYVRAGNSITGDSLINPIVQPKTPTAAQAAVVRQNAAPNGAIGLLHQGFQYRCVQPPTRSFFTSHPEHAKIRDLARLLALQARVGAAQGDWAGAMAADLDCVRMGEDLSHGSGLIGMLVGDACESIGRRPAWKTVDQLNAAQARAAAQRLEAIRARHVPFADTMQEEKWTDLAGLMEMMRRPDWPGASSLFAPGNGTPSFGETLSGWRTAALIRATGKQAILSNVTRYADQSISNARQPYAAHLPDPTPASDPISQILFSNDVPPVYGKAHLREAVTDTQNALLMTRLALRAYKMEHGTYPAALSALAPSYLKAVPSDPFALSGPLRYKPAGGQYVLYSVGPDGRDDGGRPIFDAAKPAPSAPGATDPRYYVMPDSQGDVVAGVNVN